MTAQELSIGKVWTKNTWTCDNGSTCHIKNSCEGIVQFQELDDEWITVGNGKRMKIIGMAKYPCVVKQRNGRDINAVLSVKICPEAYTNLFALGRCLRLGYNLGNEREIISLSKGETRILFDIVMDTKSGGFLSGVEIMSKKIDDSANLNVNDLHRMLGHTSEAVTRKTAKSMGHEVTSIFQPCPAKECLQEE